MEDNNMKAENEFLKQEKERRLSELEIINLIGKFSNKNMKFINDLKKNGWFQGNEKRCKKNTIYVKRGIASCTIIFDYDKLDIKTKGDSNFCDELMKLI